MYPRGRVRGRRRELRFGFVAALVLVAVAAWPAAGGAFKIPKLPKTPKFTSYPITVDAAGYVDFEWTWDDRQAMHPRATRRRSARNSPSSSASPCATGGQHRSAAPSTMPFAIGGEAKVKAKARRLPRRRTTARRPRSTPEPPAPECKTLAGKLAVVVTPQGRQRRRRRPGPARARGVLISFIRKGGGIADAVVPGGTARACTRSRKRQGVIRRHHASAHRALLTVPLTNDTKFWSLKPGERHLAHDQDRRRLRHRHGAGQPPLRLHHALHDRRQDRRRDQARRVAPSGPSSRLGGEPRTRRNVWVRGASAAPARPRCPSAGRRSPRRCGRRSRRS